MGGGGATTEQDRALLEEMKQIAEEMDTLSDQVGISFWDGWDVVLWIIAAIVALIGFLAAAASAGASLLLPFLALVIAALDIIAKLVAAADDAAEKEKADELERRVRDPERRLRERLPGGG